MRHKIKYYLVSKRGGKVIGFIQASSRYNALDKAKEFIDEPVISKYYLLGYGRGGVLKDEK